MKGFEQIDHVHYNPNSTATSVTNDMTTRVILTKALIDTWIAHIVYVKGAFLNGDFVMKKKSTSIYLRDLMGVVIKEDIIWIDSSSSNIWENIVKGNEIYGIQKKQS